MGYVVIFFWTRLPAESAADLTPENLRDMGSGDDLQRRLAVAFPELEWTQIKLRCHWGYCWRDGTEFCFRFTATPSNNQVELQCPGGRANKESFVQRVCDAMGWVAIIDPHGTLPPWSERKLLLPRPKSDTPAHPA